ncbi:MAG: hypothetical protein Q9162_002154 [Coniocarpon cinnabarinum]
MPLKSEQGLAILSVFKAGFIGSGRFGSGVIVARRGNGSWSAPSGIGMLGGGFGGQIGFELTDFVFIINDYMTLKTFAQLGSLQLGGNVALAAGPVGRNAEAAGGVSLKGVGGVFSYSKTKGLFAGVSLEGSTMIERRDANGKLYGRQYKAAELLMTTAVDPPPSAEPLMRILDSRVFSSGLARANTEMYNDIPIYDDAHEDVIWQGSRGSAYGEGVSRTRTGSVIANDYEYRDSPTSPQRGTSWQDDIYDHTYTSPGLSRSATARDIHSPGGQRSPISRANPSETFDRLDRRSRASSLANGGDYVYSDKPRPSRPTAPKPVFSPQKTGAVGANQAKAKFDFDAEKPGDLGFKKNDIISIIERTDKDEDWWTGRIGERTGVFPR